MSRKIWEFGRRRKKTFFDEFDAQALQEQMDLQMRVSEEAKKQGLKEIPQVLWIFDDLVDDERVMHSNSNLIATLAIRSRHFGGNLWVSTQKFRALANIIRINLTSLFIWPALSNRLERKAIIEEISGHYSPDQIEELLQHVSKRKHGFLFVNLKAPPDEMFQDSLVQKLRITKKQHGNALGDATQHPEPTRDAERDDR